MLIKNNGLEGVIMDLKAIIAQSIVLKHQFGTPSDNSANKISIGFGINVEFARPMGACITSIAINNPELFLDFYILANSIEQDDLDRLKKLSAQFTNILITVYTIDDAFISHLPTQKHFPPPIYYRFFLPFILRECDKLLYLDADILCLQEISELLYLDLRKHSAAVVFDSSAVTPKHSKILNLKHECYFNSGVLLINVPQWLEQNISEKAISLLSDRARNFRLPDQDALNLVLETDKIKLPKKWNHLSHMDNNYDIPKDTIFLHCTRRPKPWGLLCDKKTQAHQLYSHYESLSPWSGLPLMPPTIPSDARKGSKKFFSEGDICSGILWYCKYLKMKFIKSGPPV